uniref:Knottin scorpion toxin-like domain-containing protein n=1 Tax=Picea sitchensis TaxID=3332 RepID=A9NYM7_PICSI|nr:unknown [Picea sitchensis]
MRNSGRDKFPAAMNATRALFVVLLLLLTASNEFESGIYAFICERSSRKGGGVYCPEDEDDCAKICINKERATHGKCHGLGCLCYFDHCADLKN